MVHSSRKASALERSPSKMAGSLPLSFVPLLRSSGSLLTLAAPGGPPGGPPPPPPSPPFPSSPPPPPCSGAQYRNPEPPKHGMSPGGPPPFRSEDVPSSVLITCVGSVVVCVAITVVMGGNLEEAVWLVGLDRTGNCSANFSSCLSVLSSSLVGILMSILSARPLLLASSSSELFPLSMGPHSLRSVTSESGISRPSSGLGML